MKVMTVIGARPQFIKAAVVSRTLRRKHKEVLVHTGQHFDYNMSGCFFDELDIPKPDYNLGISGGTHAEMTGKMMAEIEKVLFIEKPDCLILYGDTNSTLAGALAAAKLHIPICHVEAGIRTKSMANPEEINRICTDHISTLLLTSVQSAMQNLEKENLLKQSCFTGDPMYDAFLEYSEKIVPQEVSLSLLGGGEKKLPEKYFYLTCHREENTGDDKILCEILNAMEELEYPVVYPVHPRNKKRVMEGDIKKFNNTIFTEPVGYLESICMVNNAEKIITDSGGLQREAFFAKKKCLTILDFISWPETMIDGRNELSLPNASEILEKLNHGQTIRNEYQPFGDGHAAEKIVKRIEDFFGD